MDTLVDQVVWHGQSEPLPIEETCTVMTRRIRWLFVNLSRTTVLPDSDCGFSTSGFIIWWKTSNPDILQRIHNGMVQTIKRIGFTEPATWCNRRHLNRSPKTLENYWRNQLGDIFCYYRKAT